MGAGQRASVNEDFAKTKQRVWQCWMLEALSGRDWGQLAQVLRAPVVAAPVAAPRPSPTSFARLPEQDMDIYGLAPTSDPLLLVVCSRCLRHIKASRFASHFERCAKREEEEKMNQPKRPRLDATDPDDVVTGGGGGGGSLPIDSPKRSTSGAPGKAKGAAGAAPLQLKRSAGIMAPAGAAAAGTGGSAGMGGAGRRKGAAEMREWSGSESDSSDDDSAAENYTNGGAGVVLIHAGAWAVAPLRTRIYSRPNPLRRAPPLPPPPSSLSVSSSALATPLPLHGTTYYASPAASAASLTAGHHTAVTALKPPGAMIGTSLQLRKLPATATPVAAAAPIVQPPKLAPSGAASATALRSDSASALDMSMAKKMGDARKPSASPIPGAAAASEIYSYAPVVYAASATPTPPPSNPSPLSTAASPMAIDYAQRTAAMAAATRASAASGGVAMAPAKAAAKAPVPLPGGGVPTGQYKPPAAPLGVAPGAAAVPAPLPLSLSSAPSPLTSAPTQQQQQMLRK